MPYVQITWSAGRTIEQKRKVAKQVTDILVEEGHAKRESVLLAFVDLPHTDFAPGGVLLGDPKPTP